MSAHLAEGYVRPGDAGLSAGTTEAVKLAGRLQAALEHPSFEGGGNASSQPGVDMEVASFAADVLVTFAAIGGVLLNWGAVRESFTNAAGRQATTNWEKEWEFVVAAAQRGAVSTCGIPPIAIAWILAMRADSAVPLPSGGAATVTRAISYASGRWRAGGAGAVQLQSTIGLGISSSGGRLLYVPYVRRIGAAPTGRLLNGSVSAFTELFRVLRGRSGGFGSPWDLAGIGKVLSYLTSRNGARPGAVTSQFGASFRRCAQEVERMRTTVRMTVGQYESDVWGTHLVGACAAIADVGGSLVSPWSAVVARRVVTYSPTTDPIGALAAIAGWLTTISGWDAYPAAYRGSLPPGRVALLLSGRGDTDAMVLFDRAATLYAAANGLMSDQLLATISDTRIDDASLNSKLTVVN